MTLTLWPHQTPKGRWQYHTNEPLLQTVLDGGFTDGVDGVPVFEDENGMQFTSDDFRPGEYFESVA